MIRDRFDQGIVLCFTPTAGGTTYVDGKGNEQSSVAFAGAGVFKAAAVQPYVGAVGRLRIDVALRYKAGSAMGAVSIRCSVRRVDRTAAQQSIWNITGAGGATTPPYAPLRTTTTDLAGTTTTAFTQSLTSAGGWQRSLLTDDVALSGELWIEVATAGAVADEDRVTVSVVAGGAA